MTDTVHFRGHAVEFAFPGVGANAVADEVIGRINALGIIDALFQGHERLLNMQRDQHLAHDADDIRLRAGREGGNQLGF